jgi:hypothetical protein
MERQVMVGGLAVSVTVQGDERARAIDALFGHCDATNETPAIRIVEADAPHLPARPPDRVTPDAEFWIDDSGVATRHRLGTTGRRHRDRIEVTGRGGPEPDRGYRLAVQFPLIDAISLHERHVLHVAAVERDGAAVLVFGSSGAGKSTFAFGAAQHGWRIIADDLTVASLEDHRVQVTGFPKPLNVPGEVLVDAPEHGSPIPLDERGRWALPPATAVARGHYPVTTVIWVGHGSTSHRSDDLRPAPDRLRELLAAHPLSMLPRVMKSYFPLAGRLSRLPTYRYEHDPDPRRRVAAVGMFLDRMTATVT